jgi:hypothetical protein
MSVSEWPVYMYGIDTSEFTFNDKVDDVFELLTELCDDHPYLMWDTNGDGEYYIGLWPQFPWQTCEGYVSLTEASVAAEIFRVLEPHLEAGITGKDVADKCKVISTTGFG